MNCLVKLLRFLVFEKASQFQEHLQPAVYKASAKSHNVSKVHPLTDIFVFKYALLVFLDF